MASTARMWQIVAMALSLAAVVWMLAPTFPMTWAGAAPGAQGPTTWHSWADPLTMGYLLFPPLVLATTLIAAIIGCHGVFRRRVTVAPAVCCGVAVALGTVFLLVAGLHAMWVIPLVLVAASGILHWRAFRLSSGSQIRP